MRKVAIYALLDPDSKKVRYVGKASNPGKRLAEHLGPASLRGRTYRSRWIASLVMQGKRPVLQILEWVPESEWSQAEKRYVAEFKSLGANLVNGDEGGLGGQTGPENRSRYLKRLMSKTYTDLIKLGQPKAANRVAKKLRALYALRPNFMPKTWETVGLRTGG